MANHFDASMINFVFIKKLINHLFRLLKERSTQPRSLVEWMTENALNMHPIKSFISKNVIIFKLTLKSLIKNNFLTKRLAPPHLRRPQKVRMPPPLAKLFFYINDTFIFKSRNALYPSHLQFIKIATAPYLISIAAHAEGEFAAKRPL